MSEPEPKMSQGHVRPEWRGEKVRVPERLFREMMKPLVFGNRQKQFTIFTAIASAVLTYYMVFEHDFGSKRHVFTWLRELKERKKREFFSIDPDDHELQRIRQRAMTKKIDSTDLDVQQHASNR